MWWDDACSTTHHFIVTAGIGRKVPAPVCSAQVVRCHHPSEDLWVWGRTAKLGPATPVAPDRAVSHLPHVPKCCHTKLTAPGWQR